MNQLDLLAPNWFKGRFSSSLAAAGSHHISESPRLDAIILPLGNIEQHTTSESSDPLSDVIFSPIVDSIIKPLQVVNTRGLVCYVMHQEQPVSSRYLSHLEKSHPPFKRPRLQHRSLYLDREKWDIEAAKKIIDCLCGETITEGIKFLIEGQGIFLRHLNISEGCCLSDCDAACRGLQTLEKLIMISWPHLNPVTQKYIQRHYEIEPSENGFQVTRKPE